MRGGKPPSTPNSQWAAGRRPTSTADGGEFFCRGGYNVTLDVSETIGALTVGNTGTELRIFSTQLTVTNAGGQAGTVTVSAGIILMISGTLSATNGITLASGTTLVCSGTCTLIGTIAGAGAYQASGGTLRIESAVLASATGLQITNNSASILELDSTVASGATITFEIGLGTRFGTLDLTDISGNLLVGFNGTIAGLAVGSSATVPTNQIDLAGLTTANITAASLNTSTDVLTVTTTGGSFTLQLSGVYAANTGVGFITDGAATGTDLFLVAGRAFSWATGSGNWSTAGDWTLSGGPPSSSADRADISAGGGRAHCDAGCKRDDRRADDRQRASAELAMAIGSIQLTVTDAGGQAGTVIATAGSIYTKVVR